MPAAPIRQSQIARVVKAAKAAGVEVARVEVTSDGMVRVFAASQNASFENKPGSAYDAWQKDRS